MKLAAPATVRLAAAWVILAAAPVALGAFVPDRAWPLEHALTVLLVLATAPLPVLWAAARPAGLEQAAERRCQLLLLVCLAAPFVALAAAFTTSASGATLSSLLYVVALWTVIALGLRKAHPGAAVAGLSVLALAFPLLAQLLPDLGADHRWVRLAAPSLAVLDLQGGGPPTPALVLLAVAALLLVFAGRSRAAIGAGLAASLLLLPGPGRALGQDVRPVLGDVVRPGESYPLTVSLGGEAGGRLAAESFRHRWELSPSSGTVSLGVRPLGSGRRLEVLEHGPGGWSRLDPTRAEPSIVSEHTLLVGALGPGSATLARRILPGRRSVLLSLTLADLPAVGLAGEAIDVIVAAPGVAQSQAIPHLRAWTAAGGCLVVTGPDDLERLSAGAAQGRAGPLRVCALGTGVVVGPAGPEGDVSAITPQRLEARLRGRARRRAIEDAALAGVRPGPSRSLRRRAGWASLGLAGALLLLLGSLPPRLPRGTLLGGAALLGVLLTGLIRGAVVPASPAYGASAAILELPAGATVARRIQLLRCASQRPSAVQLPLEGRAVPQPVFGSLREATLRGARIALADSGATIELELAREVRTYLRLDAVDLGGSVQLTRGTSGQSLEVRNGTGLDLREVYAFSAGGLYRLADLPSGAHVQLDLLARLPFDAWRAPPDQDARSWRALATAILGGRDLSRALILFARAKGTPQVRGLAEERVADSLVVVVASPEAH